jgi:hypothetical protein
MSELSNSRARAAPRVIAEKPVAKLHDLRRNTSAFGATSSFSRGSSLVGPGMRFRSCVSRSVVFLTDYARVDHKQPVGGVKTKVGPPSYIQTRLYFAKDRQP